MELWMTELSNGIGHGIGHGIGNGIEVIIRVQIKGVISITDTQLRVGQIK